jgi:DNA-binding PadR family transcriptional regulator
MRHLLLALLGGQGAYGYELKQSLDHEFGDLLPALNAGQIYMTLRRLERDGLVTSSAVSGDSRGKRVYRLTGSGRSALADWVERPIPAERFKDQFLMKLVVVASAGLAAPQRLIGLQRREYLRSLGSLDEWLDQRLADGDSTLAAELLVEGAVLHLKADLEWLDLIEQRLEETGAYA